MTKQHNDYDEDDIDLNNDVFSKFDSLGVMDSDSDNESVKKNENFIKTNNNIKPPHETNKIPLKVINSIIYMVGL